MPATIVNRSRATKRITSLAKLNWMREARGMAEKQVKAGAFRDDRHRQRALYELRDAVGLALELVEDPNIRGSVDFRHAYLERRAAAFKAWEDARGGRKFRGNN